MKKIMVVLAVAILSVSVYFLPELLAGKKKGVIKKEYLADKGPAKIDISGYPKEQQVNYKVFARRCSRCHTLARPINTDFSSKEWALYVEKMKKKRRSGINNKAAAQILSFLKYDQKTRKKKPARAKAKGTKQNKKKPQEETIEGKQQKAIPKKDRPEKALEEKE